MITNIKGGNINNLDKLLGPNNVENIMINYNCCEEDKNFIGLKLYIGCDLPQNPNYYNYIFISNYQQLNNHNNVHYLPDPNLLNPSPKRQSKSVYSKCGIFFSDNFFSLNDVQMENIMRLICKIALTYYVILYGPQANIIRDKILNRFKSPNIKIDTGDENTINDFDFAICMTYKSHIDCTVAKIPFLSIGDFNYLKFMNLSQYLCNYNEISEYRKLKELCQRVIKNRIEIKEKLIKYLRQSRFLLKSTKLYYLIKYNTSNIQDIIYDIDDDYTRKLLLSNYFLGYPDPNLKSYDTQYLKRLALKNNIYSKSRTYYNTKIVKLDQIFNNLKLFYIVQGLIPITNLWIGIVEHNINLKDLELIQSLHTCKALITFTDLKLNLDNIAPHIKIIKLPYPSKSLLDNYQIIPQCPKLITVVNKYNNFISLYKLKLNIPKYIIGNIPSFKIEIDANNTKSRIKKSDEPLFINMIHRNFQIIGYNNNTIYVKNLTIKNELDELLKSVKNISTFNNEIVFLDLIDESYISLIVECIVSRTPIIVNKLPSTIDVLGEQYPLFYSLLEEVPSLINKIIDGYEYLSAIDISKYSNEAFQDKIQELFSQD